jgi:hypothetical protein
MSTEAFSLELRGQRGWPGTLRCTTSDELIAGLCELLGAGATEEPFTITFDLPVARELREDITSLVLKIVKEQYESVEWTDELVDETGWEGSRCTIDDALAPAFAGGPDGYDQRHSGVWVDERTFLHLRLDDIEHSFHGRGDWTTTWAELHHWHPHSMTSGSWSNHLLAIEPGVVITHRSMDEDGDYDALAPLPKEPTGIAQLIAHFLASIYLEGAERHLLTLLAHGFPTDGSAAEFRIGVLPGTRNSDYEISRFEVTPPAEAAEELRRLGRLTPEGAARLAADIRDSVATSWSDVALEDLSKEWAELLAGLERTESA